MRRTKVIVTIGPATNKEDMLLELINMGVDVFRLNFSHGTVDEVLSTIKRIRRLSNKLGKFPAVLLDLPGPKLRVGDLSSGFLELKEGNSIRLSSTRDDVDIPLNVEGMEKIVKPGERILLVDGRIELKVEEVKGDEIIASVKRGGRLRSHQGLNLPDSDLPFPSLTKRDREGIELAFREDVDWVALSFVRFEEDLIELKDLVATRGEYMGVIAKIERPEAVRNIERIAEAADAVMVARGDLGVEMGVEEVPVLQKEILRLCHLKGKPTIVATQMLESMLENPFPTRAEVSDIANAIYDGADSVMLSDETAIGKYPLECVRAMLEVIERTEGSIDFNQWPLRQKASDGEIYDAIGHAACTLSCDLKVKAILCCTFSGFTAQMLSKYRPPVPIYAFTPSEFIRNKMNLIWGVYPFLMKYTDSIDELISECICILKERGLVQNGDLVIFIAGLPLKEASETNFIKLHQIR